MSINTTNKISTAIQEKLGLDLTFVLILATLLLLFAFTLPDGNALRIVFGLPFLLFLPGYSLVSALWAKKSELDGLERVALSFGLSIAIVALAGLGLNYTPWGITLISTVICLYCLIFVLVGFAWLRRSRLSAEERFNIRLKFLYNKMDPLTSADKLMILSVIIVVIIGGSMLFFIATHLPREQYTELAIFDGNGTTNDYPSNLDVNESASIIITVVCHEQQVTDYTTIVRLVPENGTNRTLAEYNFSLADGGEWEQTFNFSVNESGLFKLEVELFKGDEATPYVTNHIWITVKE